MDESKIHLINTHGVLGGFFFVGGSMNGFSVVCCSQGVFDSVPSG